ncbi:SDR family NAD(P)-dependent oxidoreductase [Tistrella mobilis]|uniref:Short-chain dehydrogenase/reductase SDR n=1 Tax=Tistrella mobilis (strain KA081020-065) TaxID=1110502 RepID=I3TPI9_TISMK|nr:SDR family NAD(P)-dependent oxidoreductase [Tistrella mobilis]AFK54677.1 short-chain dehydrogenase/reductase SDR [Tistrella mobilis KA081020-065]
MARFSGRVVIVTGAANGIGAATVRRFLGEGARVVGVDLDDVGLAAVFDGAGTDGMAVAGDCTDPAVLGRAYMQAVDRFGPIDVLFNNVGQSARERAGPFHASEEGTWRFVMEVSLMTTLRMTRLVLPEMRSRGTGRIINMSSDGAFAGDAGIVDYAAAKMGVIGFTRALARENAGLGITVNAVAPGAIATRAHDRLTPEVVDRIKAQTPAGFVGEPEDVAGVVAFLASDDARYVTGQTLLIDGGRWMI